MAKIILKTNLANKTFTVEFKSIEVTKGRSTTPPATNILISPTMGFIIDAADFSNGALPSNLSNIVYRNSSKNIDSNNKIIATVYFAKYTYANEFETIFLPISGSSVASKNEINLIETSPLDPNVFDSYSNSNNIQQTTLTSENTKTVHKVNASPGQNVNIFSKTITTPDGFCFASDPTFNIDSELINYKVTSSLVRDNDGNITSKTFNVTTVFPAVRLRKNYNDTINFLYRSTVIKDTYSKLLKENKIEPQIYDIDTGKDVGSSGGIKTIAVKGVPGTPFKVIVSNATNQSYNFETGLFEDGGFFLEGNIPPAPAGMGYGTFKSIVNVPSGDGNTVKTSLISNNKVDHEAIRDQFDSTVTGPSRVRPTTTSVIVKPDGMLRVNAYNGGESGYVIAKPLEENTEYTSGTLYEHEGVSYIKGSTGSVFWQIGPTDYRSDINKLLRAKPFKMSTLSGGGTTRTLSYLITTDADNKYIHIDRQPKFDQREDYIAWDSYFGADRTKRYNSSGLEILNDFQDGGSGNPITDYTDFKLNISANVKGIGTGPLHGVGGGILDPKMYKFVRLTITVKGTVGTGRLKTGINIKNFTTIKTL